MSDTQRSPEVSLAVGVALATGGAPQVDHSRAPAVGPINYPAWITNDSERKLHDDFRAFLWLLWNHLELPNPTRRQLAIARYLQHGPSRRMIQAFRGLGKTFITCAYALWRLYRNPQEVVKIVSANEDKALENAIFIRTLIDQVPQLAFLRPSKGQRDGALAFDVGPARARPTPSVSAVGITGQLTGGRATILISDDVEVPKNSYTETMRERLGELVKEYDALVVPEGFDIIYLGTPQTEQSVYTAVRTRGYQCRIWPIRYPRPDEMVVYGEDLAEDILADLEADPSLAGQSTEPQRFSEADIIARELSFGKSGFALQFMLNTAVSDALRYPLKLSDLIVMDVPHDMGPVRVEYTSDPRNALADLPNPGFRGDRFHSPLKVSEERAKWQGTVMIIDPSGRGEDETAYAVVRHLHGMNFLVASGGFRDGYGDATLKALVAIARRHAVTFIEIESNFADGMFSKLLEPHLNNKQLGPDGLPIGYPCSYEEYKVSGQKELRIISDLEPVMNQHKLVVDRSVVVDDLNGNDDTYDPKYGLFYQLTHITKDRGALSHEDRLECVARGCRFFREQLAQDNAQAADKHRSKMREAELDAFIKRAKGTIPKRTMHGMGSGVPMQTPQGVLRRR
jgi:hypothetical protein